MRPLARADRAPIEAILRASGAFTADEVTGALELIDESLLHPESDEYLFVVAEERDVGVSGYICFGDAPFTEGVYDVFWIAVHPERSGHGIGRALLEAAESAVRGLGGRMILIETASKPAYTTTRAFYERLGYHETARVRDYYRLGDDMVIYEKRLG